MRCPRCEHPGPRRIPINSLSVRVDYNRCGDCGHVWTTNRQTGELIEHVTDLADRK